MGECHRKLRLNFLVILALSVTISATALQRPQGRSGEERRRGDLSPLSLEGGGVVEFKTLKAATLGGVDQPFSILLPPSYAKEGGRAYPVIYFLHGLNNDETSWTVDRYGSIQDKVEAMMLDGSVPEFIMVHPRGDNSFYTNYLDGTKRYEDFVVQEIVDYVEANYRAKKGRRFRAIGGTSMGGFGALKIAMKFPDRYAAVVGHSPIIFRGQDPLDVPEQVKTSRFYQYFVNMLRPLFGDPLDHAVWEQNDPLHLARSGRLGDLGIYFDYGTDDRYNQSIGLDLGVQALDKALTETGVKHTFKVHPGEPHGWALVAAHIKESLPFLCQTFK